MSLLLYGVDNGLEGKVAEDGEHREQAVVHHGVREEGLGEAQSVADLVLAIKRLLAYAHLEIAPFAHAGIGTGNIAGQEMIAFASAALVAHATAQQAPVEAQGVHVSLHHFDKLGLNGNLCGYIVDLIEYLADTLMILRGVVHDKLAGAREELDARARQVGNAHLAKLGLHIHEILIVIFIVVVVVVVVVIVVIVITGFKLQPGEFFTRAPRIKDAGGHAIVTRLHLIHDDALVSHQHGGLGHLHIQAVAHRQIGEHLARGHIGQIQVDRLVLNALHRNSLLHHRGDRGKQVVGTKVTEGVVAKAKVITRSSTKIILHATLLLNGLLGGGTLRHWRKQRHDIDADPVRVRLLDLARQDVVEHILQSVIVKNYLGQDDMVEFFIDALAVVGAPYGTGVKTIHCSAHQGCDRLAPAPAHLGQALFEHGLQLQVGNFFKLVVDASQVAYGGKLEGVLE